jgi:hypothetical protein
MIKPWQTAMSASTSIVRQPPTVGAVDAELTLCTLHLPEGITRR